jgi:hypothetical protein
MHFFRPDLKAGLWSAAAMSNATLMHNILQMKLRHGSHVLVPVQAGHKYWRKVEQGVVGGGGCCCAEQREICCKNKLNRLLSYCYLTDI